MSARVCRVAREPNYALRACCVISCTAEHALWSLARTAKSMGLQGHGLVQEHLLDGR